LVKHSQGSVVKTDEDEFQRQNYETNPIIPLKHYVSLKKRTQNEPKTNPEGTQNEPKIRAGQQPVAGNGAKSG
jgi:hypothetical protein